MTKPSPRDALLDAGLSVMTKCGYNGSSVRDVVAVAGLPLGTFGNHFRSKESFALDVLERYFDGIRSVFGKALSDPSLSPRDRLVRYIDVVTDRLAGEKWRRGCLVGDLALEASPHFEDLRVRIQALFHEWRRPFADCIALAQEAGEISNAFDPLELAEFLLASWQGAVLRMKVEQNPAALERFQKIIFQTVFKKLG